MSPYAEVPDIQPKALADLFGGYTTQRPKKARQSERGTLLEHFSQKLSMPIPRFVWRLTGLSIKDLYYINSICDSYEREGKGVWAKCFYGSLKPADST